MHRIVLVTGDNYRTGYNKLNLIRAGFDSKKIPLLLKRGIVEYVYLLIFSFNSPISAFNASFSRLSSCTALISTGTISL